MNRAIWLRKSLVLLWISSVCLFAFMINVVLHVQSYHCFHSEITQLGYLKKRTNFLLFVKALHMFANARNSATNRNQAHLQKQVWVILWIASIKLTFSFGGNFTQYDAILQSNSYNGTGNDQNFPYSSFILNKFFFREFRNNY